MQPLTHLDRSGQAQMVDITAKTATVREATAIAIVRMEPETFAAIATGNAPKGDVLGTARLAGIMAAKQTPNLIPLCHPIPLGKVSVNIDPLDRPADISDDSPRDRPGYRIQATVKTKGETGVEMEALTAATAAALTLYDMAKALEKSICIENIHLLRKTGGKSGDYHAED
ncbi:MAG: cyclic pyranopterin monophosphate synthase MoaC [Cyanobacteria bacterium]|nr:cyclic pyranopterin monophosphate synthase MoaC [Cyanobacteriota bacterium]